MFVYRPEPCCVHASVFMHYLGKRPCEQSASPCLSQRIHLFVFGKIWRLAVGGLPLSYSYTCSYKYTIARFIHYSLWVQSLFECTSHTSTTRYTLCLYIYIGLFPAVFMHHLGNRPREELVSPRQSLRCYIYIYICIHTYHIYICIYIYIHLCILYI